MKDFGEDFNIKCYHIRRWNRFFIFEYFHCSLSFRTKQNLKWLALVTYCSIYSSVSFAPILNDVLYSWVPIIFCIYCSYVVSQYLQLLAITKSILFVVKLLIVFWSRRVFFTSSIDRVKKSAISRHSTTRVADTITPHSRIEC